MGDMTIRTIFRILAWLLVVAVVVITLSPPEYRPTTAAPADWERFVAFAAIGGAFCVGYPRHRPAFLAMTIAIAGLLEAFQDLVPLRHGRLHDGVVKMVGAMAGAFLAWLLEWASRGLRSASPD
jgi:hypothetical protein